jgi:hypothetical protein
LQGRGVIILYELLPVVSISCTEFNEISGYIITLECELVRLCVVKCPVFLEEILDFGILVVNIVC